MDEAFLPRFLARFLSADIRVARTLGRYSVAHQRTILDRSILAVLHYEGAGPGAADGIHRLVQVHSQHGDVPIDPSLYPPWVESLLGALGETDPLWNEALESKWRAVIAPVVDMLMELYLLGPPGSGRGGVAES